MPFADNEFDFVYCRHVLEDLYNPFFACDEMSRVAKAGYIETPSPLAEICRGMNRTEDGGVAQWRGYSHHRYFVWVEDEALNFIPKMPLIEYFNFGNEHIIGNNLKAKDILWNSYYFWKGQINYRDRGMVPDQAMILGAMHAGVRNANETLIS